LLDAIRAARRLDGVTMADDRTVVWGHSQGGHAALWTASLADDYAPDAGVVGVAALAPASDLVGLVDNLDVVAAGSIFASYVGAGLVGAGSTALAPGPADGRVGSAAGRQRAHRPDPGAAWRLTTMDRSARIEIGIAVLGE
jgi:pimeloyl-ACP methyl ester carboxylesterase